MEAYLRGRYAWNRRTEEDLIKSIRDFEDAIASAPDFGKASDAAKKFTEAAAKVLAVQKNPPADAAKLNQVLISAERALLIQQGLPERPWFRHAIYAPGQYTGYAAVVIPGVNEAIDAKNAPLTTQQLQVLADALNRAAGVLEGYR